MTKEIITEFVFLGNESVHNENTLYSMPLGNKVGYIYLNFYKMQKKKNFVKTTRAFYPGYALKHFENMNKIGYISICVQNP